MKRPKPPQSIDGRILDMIRTNQRGTVISARDFADAGQYAAVRQALSRLARAGRLRRVHRGYYDFPRAHPVLGQTAPDPMALVQSLMTGSSAQWQVSGAYAANLLGLSEQVPAKIVILTNGVPRRVQLDKLTLIFRRAAPRNLLAAGRPAGLVIQAIRHLRANGLTSTALARLRARIDAPTRRELLRLVPQLPAWMQPIVRDLVRTP
jgi:hypothetical protein